MLDNLSFSDKDVFYKSVSKIWFALQTLTQHLIQMLGQPQQPHSRIWDQIQLCR